MDCSEAGECSRKVHQDPDCHDADANTDCDQSNATSSTWSTEAFSLALDRLSTSPSSSSFESTPTTSPSIVASPASLQLGGNSSRETLLRPSSSPLQHSNQVFESAVINAEGLKLAIGTTSTIAATTSAALSDAPAGERRTTGTRLSFNSAPGQTVMTDLRGTGLEDNSVLPRRITSLAKGHARSLSDIVTSGPAGPSIPIGLALPGLPWPPRPPLITKPEIWKGCQAVQRASLEQALRRAEEESEKIALTVIRRLDSEARTNGNERASDALTRAVCSLSGVENEEDASTPVSSRSLSLNALPQLQMVSARDLTPTSECPLRTAGLHDSFSTEQFLGPTCRDKGRTKSNRPPAICQPDHASIRGAFPQTPAKADEEAEKHRPRSIGADVQDEGNLSCKASSTSPNMKLERRHGEDDGSLKRRDEPIGPPATISCPLLTTAHSQRDVDL